jgi:CelD/BcsL family acetyltransferase involved in cellulose biosynthesis
MSPERMSGDERTGNSRPSAQTDDLESKLPFVFEVLADNDARDWSRREGRSGWSALVAECPWATVFQSPGYFDVWCAHYSQAWSPLLVLARRQDASLAGVMPLASQNGIITGAGAHQSEYHGWVARPNESDALATGMFATLTKAMPGQRVRLRYLPPLTPPDMLARLAAADARIQLTTHEAHEFAIDRQRIDESRKKRGNKSKFNRLARLGTLEVRRLTGNDLGVHMDALAAMYDFRQGALNDACPFLDDPSKRAFHLDWIQSHPEQIFASGMFLNGRLISALLFALSKTEAHLAISAHVPDLAEHSPNKLHFYEAAMALADAGMTVIDMTPGGDAWKERFSTGRRQIVELVVYPSVRAANIARARSTLVGAVKRVFMRIGLPLETLRALRPKRPQTTPEPHAREQFYRLAPIPPSAAAPPKGVCIDDIAAITRWAAKLTRQQRQPFLRKAIERMERGEHCYTLDGTDGVTALGWLATADTPEATAKASDFTVANAAAAEAILAAMLYGVAVQGRCRALIVALPPLDGETSSAVAALGFAPWTPTAST